MEIGQRLKELRKQKKMTLKEVGDYLSLTGVAVSCYEKETRKPSPEVIEKLADLYEVTVDDLYGRQNESSNMRKILNSHTLHWDGEPLREDEINVIRQLLELRVKDKQDSRKNLSNHHIG
ncbi:helix-turn-helix domain-containing protein [Bacillaceae bacterium C204]|uniref:helix-turn-helix domain-containing protein n=1 Tax=Neobacillus sp. 204 TaxID=3383351 RepID=UPI0039781461